jgi:serine phosphatase RsbU (regulator of sigma subunit)
MVASTIRASRGPLAWTRTVRAGVLGWCGVAALAVVYPFLAEPTQHPLAIFVIPVLVTSALGAWIDTVSVGAGALAAAALVGVLSDDLETAGLISRLSIIAVCWGVAVAVAFERDRRRQIVEDSLSQTLLLDMFQDSLVPTPIPPVGVAVTTRYIPGDERMLLGGDFFDAIRLPDGSLGYIIGDVCGQGPRAAAFGAAVRSGWKTLATAWPNEPLRWVEGLDETFFRLGRHADTFVTLNTGIITLGGQRRWTFVSAGHPWPVMVGSRVATVEPRVGPPLGAGMHAAWDETHIPLVDGATILLYTDGLIENAASGQGRTNDGGARLVQYLDRAAFDIDDLLTHFGPTGFDDDVAIMTITVD